MNRNLASPGQSLLCRETRIVQPALIEEVCGAVWTSGPCQRRDGVDYKANVLYISRFFEAMRQGCHKDAMRELYIHLADRSDRNCVVSAAPAMTSILPNRPIKPSPSH